MRAIQVSIPPFYLPPKDALYIYKHMSDFYDGQIVLPEGTTSDYCWFFVSFLTSHFLGVCTSSPDLW